MLEFHSVADNHLRDYICNNLPEHLGGYDQGWLLIKHIHALGQRFSHIYSWEGRDWVLVGTYVGFDCVKED